MATAVVAGCGGTSSGTDVGAGGGGAGADLTLVAYSAPREVYEELIPRFGETAAGREVDFVGEAFVRPHDLELLAQPNGSTQEAQVERLAHLGFEVGVELVRDDPLASRRR